MRRSFVLMSCLLFMTVSLAFAQSDVPATREDVMKLFDTMNIREQMKLVMESVSKQQRTMIHDAMRKRFPQISDEELARLDRFSTDVLKDMPVDGMLDDMIPVYQKHLTKSDVEAMDTFYSSPTGKKLLREMPEMTAESIQAANPRIQQMMDKVMDRAEKMAKEDQQKETGSAHPTTGKN